jgi:hypothetical protein
MALHKPPVAPPPVAPKPARVPKAAAKLHASVLRVICALVNASAGKIGIGLFESTAHRLQRMSSATACKALREFAGEVRAAGAADPAKLLSDVLSKHETAATSGQPAAKN